MDSSDVEKRVARIPDYVDFIRWLHKMSKKINDPPAQVTFEEFFTAQEHWGEFWLKELGLNKVPSFNQFLGIGGKGKVKVTTRGPTNIRISAVRKIKMLSGPHAHTYLKAYQHKKGLK